MNNETVEAHIRRLLLGLAACMCLGTIAELWFAKHTEEPLQLVPFGLCVLGLGVVLLMLKRPSRRAAMVLRGVMLIVVAGSLLGIYEHVAGNIAFKLELQPNATLGDVWLSALRGGNPILAPGVLAVTGIIAIIATYKHPALSFKNEL